MRGLNSNKNNVSARIINIATLAVSIGIATILIALSVSKGLQNEIENKTGIFNGHILVTLFENNESKISLLPINETPEIKEKFLNKSNVSRFHPVAIKAGIMKNKFDFEGILFKGVNSDFDSTSLKSFFIRGHFPNLTKGLSKEILISETLSKKLSLDVGDKTDVFFQNYLKNGTPSVRRFTVSGIFLSGFPDIDENLIYGDIRHVQKINKWRKNQIGAYEVFVKNFDQLKDTNEKIYNDLPAEINSIAITERYPSIYKWIALFDFNVLIILIIMILVGLINMATALLVIVLERTKMVGLLKAIGFQNNTIRKIFLLNGMVILGKGLFFGNIVGLGFYILQKNFGLIKLDPATYFVELAPVKITFFQIIFVNGLFLIISAFILWIPLKIILNINPSQALNTR